MQVVAHQPHAWFLLREGDELLLDVNCDFGAIGYSVLLRLNQDETEAYSRGGTDYLNELAQNVQDAGPRGAYQQRNLTGKSEAVLEAIRAWRG